MTLQDYKETIKSLDEQMVYLREVKDKARKEFLAANAQFKVGDKVRVFKETYKPTGQTEYFKGEFFVSSVNDKYFDGSVDYDFVKIKKDGTPSGQSAGVYSFSRLEKVEDNNAD
jgi:hypothetical protein